MNCLACKVEGLRKKATKGKFCDYHYEEGKAKKRSQFIPLRDIWYTMIGKCYKEHWKLYETYGAKGYTVCPEWRDSRNAFIDWSKKQGYKRGMKLVVEGKEYGPETCKFEEKKR